MTTSHQSRWPIRSLDEESVRVWLHNTINSYYHHRHRGRAPNWSRAISASSRHRYLSWVSCHASPADTVICHTTLIYSCQLFVVVTRSESAFCHLPPFKATLASHWTLDTVDFKIAILTSEFRRRLPETASDLAVQHGCFLNLLNTYQPDRCLRSHDNTGYLLQKSSV